MKYYASLRPPIRSFEHTKRMVEAGISGFEVSHVQSYVSPEEHASYLEMLERIKAELLVGFSLHAPIKDVHLGSTNSRVREVALAEIKGSLDLARELEASVVVVHPAPGISAMPAGEWSRRTPSPSSNEELAKQEALLVRAVKDLADYAPDILLGLENLVFPHELYRSPEEMASLLAKVNRSNVGLTLDVGHAQISGYRAAEFIEVIGHGVFHVHFHDNNGNIDEHLRPGEGVVDFTGVLHALREIDYQGLINFEFSAKNPEDYTQYIGEFDKVW